MNTIQSNSVVQMAMDGQSLYKSAVTNAKSSTPTRTISVADTPSRSEVAQSIEKNLADIKADTIELQKMSDMIEGRKLQFSVNKELGSVIVRIMDSNNQVLKEIPSEDMQRLKLRIRRAIGKMQLN